MVLSQEAKQVKLVCLNCHTQNECIPRTDSEYCISKAFRWMPCLCICRKRCAASASRISILVSAYLSCHPNLNWEVQYLFSIFLCTRWVMRRSICFERVHGADALHVPQRRGGQRAWLRLGYDWAPFATTPFLSQPPQHANCTHTYSFTHTHNTHTHTHTHTPFCRLFLRAFAVRKGEGFSFEGNQLRLLSENNLQRKASACTHDGPTSQEASRLNHRRFRHENLAPRNVPSSSPQTEFSSCQSKPCRTSQPPRN